MRSFIKSKTPNPLEHYWREMEKTKDYAFCQCFDWQISSFTHQRIRRFANMLLGKRVFYFAWFNRERPLIIGAVELKKGEDKGISAKAYKPSTYSDIIDFLYSPDLSPDDLKLFIEDFAKEFKANKLVLPFLNAHSPMASFARSHSQMKCSETGFCPAISPQEPCEWLRSLSPGTKQNLRTCKNRLRADQKRWTILTLRGKTAANCHRKTKHIKKQRCIEKNPGAKGIGAFIKRLADRVLRLNTFDNVVDFYLKHFHEKSCLRVLTIDGHPAAVAVCCDSSLSSESQMPELYYDSGYSRYSPGMVLLENTIEEQLKLNKAFNFLFGEEVYKFRLGANRDELYSVEIFI